MTECKYCHADLSRFKEVHAVYGDLFCSRECAIAYLAQGIVRTADIAAYEEYNEAAEVVATKDILSRGRQYNVTVREVLERTVSAYAESAGEALASVEADWNDCEIVLDSGDFVGVDFVIKEVSDE